MSVVDDVKARLDIVDVVSGYANLQKAGRNFKALCPFHQERTPSFVVFPDTQTWRCFGACGEGGDLFSFVMRAEGWDFREALRQLANRAGITLEDHTPEQVERDAETDRLRGLLDETARFFHRQLLEAPAGQLARDYVARRGLSIETVATFMLGYAPNDWRQTLQHLNSLGYSEQEALAAGVATRNEQGRVYDRFRHRLVIPIRDSRGRTVGFGARALEKDDVPKYLNSPQSALFDKSRLLFGLDTARRAIRESETVVIVEGYMDAMQAYQAGFTNVVAQMGTALTEEQLKQLERYAKRLILALDPDTAGINATMRGLNVAQQHLEAERTPTFDPRGMMRYTGMLSMDIRVISLPAGQDPDDLIREQPEEWPRLIDRAVPVADYVIQQGCAHLGANASYQEREQVARTLLPILMATESDIQRSGNIQALARRVHIDERVLIQWTQRQQIVRARALPTIRQQRQLADRFSRAVPVSGPPGQSVLREAFCLQMLLQQPERLFNVNRQLRELQRGSEHLASVLAPMNANDFTRADYQIIFGYIEQSLYQDEQEPLDFLHHTLPYELAETLEELKVQPLESFTRTSPRDWSTELRSIQQELQRGSMSEETATAIFVQHALELRLSRLERELRELYFLQQDAQAANDQDAEEHYTHIISAYVRARQLITITRKAVRQV